MHLNDNDRARKVLTSQPGGSRPRGRPKLRWEDQLAEDAARAVVSECLLSLCADIFVFQFTIKKCKDKMYRIIILPVVLFECETWSLVLLE